MLNDLGPGRGTDILADQNGKSFRAWHEKLLDLWGDSSIFVRFGLSFIIAVFLVLLAVSISG